MSFNAIFLIVGCALLGVSVALAIVFIKKDFNEHPDWDVLTRAAFMVCAAGCVAFMILSVKARECPNCDILVEGNFCEACGYQVREEKYPQKQFCRVCGYDINENAAFCGHCGAKNSHQ